MVMVELLSDGSQAFCLEFEAAESHSSTTLGKDPRSGLGASLGEGL